MKIGVCSNLRRDLPWREALEYFAARGIEAVEVGVGGYPGKEHCDADVLLNDEAAYAEWKKALDDTGIVVSGFSCHSNPLHPDKAFAAESDHVMRNAVLMAEKYGIHNIECFSGCPGDSEGSKYPNWVVCPWPFDFAKILDYQWNEVMIPYWKNFVEFAKAHGVNQIAIEMHPGFTVYNTQTLLRLREEVGPEIGANFDPSHLIWQGMDPVTVIRALEGMIYHVHAKDTRVDEANTKFTGVLDTKPYWDNPHRSWSFRSCGYGNDTLFWKDIVSNLRMTGYDGVMCIEHEDGLMSLDEGLRKAVACMQESIIRDPQTVYMA